MTTICKKFGRKVKQERLKKGLSQEELAELSELHRTYISAVERGVRSISLNNIEKISKALHIQEKTLFNFEDLL